MFSTDSWMDLHFPPMAVLRGFLVQVVQEMRQAITSPLQLLHYSTIPIPVGGKASPTALHFDDDDDDGLDRLWLADDNQHNVQGFL